MVMAKTTKSSTKQASTPDPIRSTLSKGGKKKVQGRSPGKVNSTRSLSGVPRNSSSRNIKVNGVSQPKSPEQAIQLARTYLINLLDLTEEPILEEIEKSKDKHWYITYSISDAAKGNYSLLPLIPRKYKTLKIDALTGELISISIHESKR